ncbi:hypothetical protein [Streptomyces chattanoogensis]|uniref:hypothetical protein n=1 Tax=Streptomyces chattanoogensis TaxID=66876 RepID=UPI0036B33F72
MKEVVLPCSHLARQAHAIGQRGNVLRFLSVPQVFEVPGLADEPVEVVEVHAVDDAICEAGQELAEFGAQDDPVDGAVRLDALALFEGRGVVLPVDLGEWSPAQAGAGVLCVFELVVDAGFEAEAVGGDALVGAGALGGVGRQVVVEVEGDLAAAGMGGDLEILPDGGGCCWHGVGSWCPVAPDTGHFPPNSGVWRCRGSAVRSAAACVDTDHHAYRL